MKRFLRGHDVEDVLSAIEDAGAVVVTEFLPEPALGKLRRAVQTRADAASAGGGGQISFWKKFHGSQTKRFTGIGLTSDVFFELLDDRYLASLADHLLGDSGHQYWMNTCQAMIIGPGEAAQVLHRDGDNWSNVMARTWPVCPELTVSMMLALEDVDELVGATRVIPGSHRWTEYERPANPDEAIPATLRAGDALIYSGRVFHGGGANQTTDRWRWALHLSFVVGWLTPEEAASQIYPAALIQNRSARVKRLLGMSSFNPYPGRGGRLWLKDFEEWTQPRKGGLEADS
ncbi:MAG: phytanoyl-CoA dioxygenase family protein [Pseudomonadales bacterium]